MRFDDLRWMLVPAIALHNFEEWTVTPLLPDVSMTVGAPVQLPSWQVMEVALLLATLVPTAVIVWAATGPKRVRKDWAVCWVGAIFGVNALVPHVLVSIQSARYTPGFGSAVLCTLPLSLLLLRRALLERRLTRGQLVSAIVVGAIALPASIALMIGVARALIGS